MYNVRYFRDFLHKLWFIKHLFKSNINAKSKKRQQLFERFAFYNDFVLKCALVLYIGASLSFFPYPMYMYVFERKFVPLILIYIPGIDETTIMGYLTLDAAQIVLLFVSVVGMSSCDVMYAMLIINIPIFARLIEDEINALNDVLMENVTNAQHWKHRFINILAMHQEMAE